MINWLIKQAKASPQPTELALPRHRVRQVAEHARLSMFMGDCCSCDELAAAIERGEMKILGVPVRIVDGG